MICGLNQRMETLYSMHRSIYTISMMIYLDGNELLNGNQN